MLRWRRQGARRRTTCSCSWKPLCAKCIPLSCQSRAVGLYRTCRFAVLNTKPRPALCSTYCAKPTQPTFPSRRGRLAQRSHCHGRSRRCLDTARTTTRPELCLGASRCPHRRGRRRSSSQTERRLGGCLRWVCACMRRLSVDCTSAVSITS